MLSVRVYVWKVDAHVVCAASRLAVDCSVFVFSSRATRMGAVCRMDPHACDNDDGTLMIQLCTHTEYHAPNNHQSETDIAGSGGTENHKHQRYTMVCSTVMFANALLAYAPVAFALFRFVKCEIETICTDITTDSNCESKHAENIPAIIARE